MAKEKSSSSKKKKKDGESSKKASTSGKKNTTSSSVKTKSSSKKGSMTKASKQAINCKPPKSKVTKTSKKKTGNASKKSNTNKSTAKNKTKLKAKMVAKPIEEEETTESSEEVQVAQSKKEDKKTKNPNASTSKAAKNKAQLPQVKPTEVQEADQETKEEPVAVETSAAEPTETEPSQTEHETCDAKAESSSNQTEASGEEGEAEEGTVDTEAVEEEKLEFTKPTINQIKKDTKEKPLSMSEKITAREFESLNDGITDLKSGVQMLKHSYASIIKSLVAMQNRRSKKKAAKEVQEKVAADGKPINFLTTLSTADPNELKTKSCLEATDKYDIERFLNPITRDETFKALFDEVDELNKQTEKLRTSFFDQRGAFLRDKYDSQDEVKLDRAQFNEFKLWTKKLAAIVDDIARNYNDDLLNMFRLT